MTAGMEKNYNSRISITHDEEVSIIFSKKFRLKLIYFSFAIMLFLHSFQGFQGWDHESKEDKVYTTSYSVLDTFLIDLAQKMNHGTRVTISLDIIIAQFSTADFLVSLLQWQINANNQITHGTLSFLVYGEIFGLGGTSYSLLLLVGTINVEKLKYQETRRNKNKSMIITTISENPGISLREIQRSTNLAMGIIQYHIRSLESGEYEIESLRFGRSKHFFLSSARFSIEQKLWFSLNRNQNIKNILDLLLVSGTLSQKDISLYTGRSKSLISYYTKVLRFNGVIKVENNQLRISEDFNDMNSRFFH